MNNPTDAATTCTCTIDEYSWKRCPVHAPGIPVAQPLRSAHQLRHDLEVAQQLHHYETVARQQAEAELKKADDTIALLMERNSAHASTIAEQKRIIEALNTGIGGEGSTTTENAALLDAEEQP